MTLFRLGLAAILTGFAMWLSGGIWHEIISAHFYSPGTEQDHEGIWLILIAYIVLGALMLLLYRQLFPHGTSLIQSLLFGAVIGILWVFPHSLALAAAHGEPLPYVFQNAGWHIIEQSIGALVLHYSLVYSKTWQKDGPETAG